MTGCARFFLVILILAPLAYLGAAYYNGQDGIQNIKNLLGIGHKSNDSKDDTYMDTSRDLEKDLSEKDKEIQRLNDKNKALEKENQELKDQIENLQKTEDNSQ